MADMVVKGGLQTAAAARIGGIHANRVLASLPRADLALLARHLHVVSLPAGAVLQHQDHPLNTSTSRTTAWCRCLR